MKETKKMKRNERRNNTSDQPASAPVDGSFKARIRRIPPVIWLAAAFLIMAWWALPIRNGVFMRWMEDCSLFDPSDYGRDQLMRYPGGLLQYIGSYLMQFMHIPKLGSSILFALWMLLAFMTVRCFRLPSRLIPLSLLIPILMLRSVLMLDESWLTILYKGFIFAPTIGFICVTALVWIWRLIRPWWGAALFSLLTVCLYPWLGFFALLAGVVQAVLSIMQISRNTPTSGKSIYGFLTTPVIVLILAICVPVFYYRNMPGTWVEGNHLWVKGLPDLMLNDNDAPFFLPFFLSSLLLLLFACLTRFRKYAFGKWYSYWTVLLVVMAGFWCSGKIEKSEQWRAMALMQLHIDRLNWDRVVMVADNMKGPLTPELAYLAQMGRNICGMPQMKYNISEDYPDADNLRKRPAFLRTAFLSVPADYFLGETNRSYRWAMEHSVKYGHRAFLLKYMVRSCLLNGDYELARRYNDMLARTLFHREWSEHYGKFIDDPSLIPGDPELGSIHTSTAPRVFY
ncbi:MAG: hypothetical protein K2M04_05770 [Muribaculaceae bacterium]|nr:hypothetical protein [Muribaculaceae bacterium]